MGKKKKKGQKNGHKSEPSEKILLATVTVQLIQALIELVKAMVK